MKRMALIGSAVIALVLLAALALPFLIDPNTFRPMLEEKLTESLGREGAKDNDNPRLLSVVL
jgi:uncharacterized protein involved in outer membrane biogenesis